MMSDHTALLAALTIGLAFILDLLIGDPPHWPHPVRLIGWAIDRISGLIERCCRRSWMLRPAGMLMVVLIVGGTWLVGWILIRAAQHVGTGFGLFVGVYLAYTALAARGLYQETWRAAEALQDGELDRARKLTGMVVGRETHSLDRSGVLRALVETVAENLSDGVIAPLFYLALGGPALGLAYKAINTLDSMVGYKNERYLRLGWAAARLDDLANYVPARISALLIVAASWPLGLDGRGAYGVWRRDRRRHSSPNAGHPEAAMAGALGIQLGGPSRYLGRLVDKPCIGEPKEAITIHHLRLAEDVLFLAGGMMLVLALIIRSVT